MQLLEMFHNRNDTYYILYYLAQWLFKRRTCKKNPPVMREIRVESLGWEDPLEEGPATHSSILALRIPWTEEPGGLQSMR